LIQTCYFMHDCISRKFIMEIEVIVNSEEETRTQDQTFAPILIEMPPPIDQNSLHRLRVQARRVIAWLWRKPRSMSKLSEIEFQFSTGFCHQIFGLNWG
jgi:hypothetical protein